MTEIAHLKVQLDDVEPRVVRQLEVPLSIRLDALHLVIQAAMPWENYHLYEFRAGKRRWGEPDPGWDFGDSPMPAKKMTLVDLVDAAPRTGFKYVYDFGDDWVHSVKIVTVVAAEPGVAYPRLIAAEGRCPPEDVGGAWGYADYLEAMADPKHERHAEMVEWRGADFDPQDPGKAEIEKRIAALARRWSRCKPAKPKQAD